MEGASEADLRERVRVAGRSAWTALAAFVYGSTRVDELVGIEVETVVEHLVPAIGKQHLDYSIDVDSEAHGRLPFVLARCGCRSSGSAFQMRLSNGRPARAFRGAFGHTLNSDRLVMRNEKRRP